jgi:hypothetical protein
MVRIISVIGMLVVALGVMGVIFWQQELQYQRPTPVPKHYQAVGLGNRIDQTLLPGKGAYFLHFYNPDCPCSRFNAKHVKSLIQAYGDSVAMYIVVRAQADLAKAQRAFADQQFIVDQHGTLAGACGVYATPQAVIIDAAGSLYYRGNYNRSRYCTAKATNFAELSLLALMKKQPSPAFGLLATQAYGCSWQENNDTEFF